MRIAYLFTTFPKPSESFLQREINGLADLPTTNLSLFSLFGGCGATFNRFPLKHFDLKDILRLPLRFLNELIRSPEAFLELSKLYDNSPPKCPINLLENLLGVAFAISYAERFRKNPPDLIHAVWATAPAAAALTLSMLTRIPYSMEAHAYDIHRSGGDCLLKEKGLRARFIRTSTQSAQSHLIRKGIPEKSISLIRRSLPNIPDSNPARRTSNRRHLLSVGRLIEKKGYAEQLNFYKTLKNRNIQFSAKIIGHGPLASPLESIIKRLELSDCVEMCGHQSYAEIERTYQQWADIFIFTGKISSSGDRDGFPNVLAEAMAAGLPILTRDVAGISEAIQDKVTGIILRGESSIEWSHQFEHLMANPILQDSIKANALEWVKQHFAVSENSARLVELFTRSQFKEPSSPHT